MNITFPIFFFQWIVGRLRQMHATLPLRYISSLLVVLNKKQVKSLDKEFRGVGVSHFSRPGCPRSVTFECAPPCVASAVAAAAAAPPPLKVKTFLLYLPFLLLLPSNQLLLSWVSFERAYVIPSSSSTLRAMPLPVPATLRCCLGRSLWRTSSTQGRMNRSKQLSGRVVTLPFCIIYKFAYITILLIQLEVATYSN